METLECGSLAEALRRADPCRMSLAAPQDFCTFSLDQTPASAEGSAFQGEQLRRKGMEGLS